MSRLIEAVSDTLSQKPEIGIFGSMAGVALSPIAVISLLSAILGLIVTFITLVIKVMDIIDKIKRKRRGTREELDDIFIDNKRYKRVVDEEESE